MDMTMSVRNCRWASCSFTAGQAAAQTVAVVDAARAALPAKVRDGGTLNIATALQWAPFASRNEKDEAVGIDISLMKVIAAKLGLKPAFEDLKFPAIIPGVQSGRFHVGVDQLSMSPERLQLVVTQSTSVLLRPPARRRRGPTSRKTFVDAGQRAGAPAQPALSPIAKGVSRSAEPI